MSENEPVAHHLTKEEEEKRLGELANFSKSEAERINDRYDAGLNKQRDNMVKYAVAAGLLQQKKASKLAIGKMSREAVLLDIQKNVRKKQGGEQIEKKKK